MGEFRNYYEIVPKKYIDEPIEYASFKQIQIVLPAMIGIVGGTGSGKTNILMNLIHDMNAFTKIFIFARDIEETFYQWIIDRLTISGKKVGKELLQYSNSLNQLPPVTTIQGTKGKKEWDSILMIFDDMITAGTKDMTKMVDYFIAARKKKCTCVFLSQNYFEIPAMIRTNCHYFFFTKLRSSQDCARVLNDFQGLDIHVDENLGSTEASKQKGKWMKIIYQLASHNETFGHALMIDCKAPKGSPLQFREKYTPLVHLYPQLIPILTPNLDSKDEKKEEEDKDDDKEEEDDDGEDDDDGSQSDVDGTPGQENARLKAARSKLKSKGKASGKRQRYRASPYKVRIPRARDDLDPNLRPYNQEKAHKQRDSSSQPKKEKRKKKVSGDGVLLNLVTNVVDPLASRLLRRAPTSVVDFLSHHGNEVIETLKLERTPVTGTINAVINAVSRGKFNSNKRKLKYDQVYHLYLVINGRWIVEKNHKVEFKRFGPRDHFEAQHLAASGPRRDLNAMMKNLEQKTDAPKIWRYNPETANCQHFIQDLLRSNGWLTHYANEFIKQDAKELLKDTPKLHTLTDAAALLNRIID